MKTAIYIEDGITQLVLTPENKWEEQITDSICKETAKATIMRGQFYTCQGGWDRKGDGIQSMIIRVESDTK